MLQTVIDACFSITVLLRRISNVLVLARAENILNSLYVELLMLLHSVWFLIQQIRYSGNLFTH